jgi:hypothetical protein
MAILKLTMLAALTVEAACDYQAAYPGSWEITVAPSGTWRTRVYTCGYCVGPQQTATTCVSYTVAPTNFIEDWDPIYRVWVPVGSCCSCTDYYTKECDDGA